MTLQYEETIEFYKNLDISIVGIPKNEVPRQANTNMSNAELVAFYSEQYVDVDVADILIKERRERLYGLCNLLKPEEFYMDVGCANGAHMEILHQRGINGIGLDLSIPNILRGRQKYPHLKFIHGFAEAIPFKDNYFDIVILGDAIEHFRNPKVGLAECLRVSRKGLALCIPIMPEVTAEHINPFSCDEILNLLKFYKLKVHFYDCEGRKIRRAEAESKLEAFPWLLIRADRTEQTNTAAKGITDTEGAKEHRQAMDQILSNDEWRLNTEHQRDETHLNRFKLLSHLIEGQKVLEIGCGNGDLSVEMAKLGFDVVSVDISKLGIQQAVELAKKENLDTKAHFRVMDATRLEFADNSFDTVLIPEVLEHIRDSRRLIKEAIRVVRNGGRILISVPNGLLVPFQGHLRVFFKDTLTTELSQHTSEIRWHELPFKKWLVCSFFVRKKGRDITEGPPVDILMPTYNGRKYIRKAIKSILDQTYQNWNLVVVNDGGEDVKDILDEFHDHRIKYIVTMHKGKAHALNVGIANSNGKFIGYLDDDDILYPIHLEVLIKASSEGKKDFVYSDWYEVSLDENEKEIAREFEFRKDVAPWMLIRQNYINHKCILHARSLLEKAGMYDEELDVVIDWDMIRRLAFVSEPYHVWGVTSERLRYYNKAVIENRITGLWTRSSDKARRSMERIANKTMNLPATTKELKRAVIDAMLHQSYYHSLELRDAVQAKDTQISNLEANLKEKISNMGNLEAAITGKDGHISHLEGAVRGKEAEAEGLRAGLEEKERKIGSLQETINRKETQISQLEALVSEKGGEIGNFKEMIDQKAIQISHLEGAVRGKEAEAEGLGAGLEEKDGEIGNLNEIVTQRDARVVHLEGVVSGREATLNHIYNSHGWKALSIYYRLRDMIFPINTKRRLLAKILFKLVTNPRGILKNLNKRNLKKFCYYFRMAEPAIVEQKIEKKISDVSEIGESSAVSEPLPIKTEFERNVSEERIKGLDFPYYDQRLVSIIIPVRDNWRYTYACLKSILQNTKEVPFEVIIVNDQSTDETSEMLKRISGIQIINNPINLGWVRNCNNAADHAKGKYILLLNNDTEVTEGWLTNLVRIAESDEKIGVVGGKILYPDGRLQEAGSVMDAGGWGQPFGRYADPDGYEYNYVKETDFITGVCLLIRKDIFLKMGGFDERYAPAFYEEFDLEFAIREAGYKIIYQPKAVIIHHQTSSYGTEIRDSLSSINHTKFIKKWENQISEQTEHSDIFLARDRSKNRKVILLIDERIPDYDKNAGSLTTYQYIRLFQEVGFKVIFIPDSLVPLEPYTTELEQMGIEVVYGQFDFESWIKQNGSHIHYAWLSRPQIAVKYIEAMKRYSKAKICYYTHDLHYLRELRRYEIEKKKEIFDESNRIKKVEFYLFENVDVILTPSDYEQKVIKEIFVDKHVVTIPAYYYDVDSVGETISGSFDGRSGLIFLGGFGHLPNVDAVKWFVNEIYPAIKKEVPEIKFYIVGSNPPPEITALSRSDIIVTGYVKDLGPLFQKCRVFVCPLRYGAGVKGKTVMSMYYGVPAVSTSVGNEGLDLKHCAEAFIADDPIKFANWTVELYTNPKIWTKFSENSIRFVRNNFSKDKAKRVMFEILGINETTMLQNRQAAFKHQESMNNFEMAASTISTQKDIDSKKISISLVQCPAWGRETPPVAISLLAGNLRSRGYKVHLFDLNNEYHHKVSDKDKVYWGQEYYSFWSSANSVKEFLDEYKDEVEKTVEQIAATGSKIVGFSVVFTSVNFSLGIAEKLKKLSPETVILLGGPSTAEYAGGLNYLDRSFVDAIVLREGDITLPEICKDMEEKGHFEKTPGLVFKKDGEIINGGLREPAQSLDSIPFADYRDFDFTHYANPTRIDLFSSRGCINKCHFCDEQKYLQRYRYRSGKSLFEELRYHMSYNPNIKSIVFCDSVANGSLKAMREFSELLIKHDIKIAWGGQAVVRKDMDAELLNLMAKAGCMYLGYGIETGSERVLKTMNKKLLTIETAQQNLKDTHNAGIRAYANFMFGYPTETEEDFLQTLDFVRRNRQWIDGVSPSLSFTIIVPNTYLYENLTEFGLEPEKPHHLYWSTKDGKNTYPVRFYRYELFCRLCIELGLSGVGVVDERVDKWKQLGNYYLYVKDYEKAAECFVRDLLKNGYSFDSIKQYLEICTNDNEIEPFEPSKGIKRLLEHIREIGNLEEAIRGKDQSIENQETVKKASRISQLEAMIREKEAVLSHI